MYLSFDVMAVKNEVRPPSEPNVMVKWVSTHASFAGSPVFKSRLGDRLSSLKVFVVFPSSLGRYCQSTLN